MRSDLMIIDDLEPVINNIDPERLKDTTCIPELILDKDSPFGALYYKSQDMEIRFYQLMPTNDLVDSFKKFTRDKK